jgi:hypothetical protein
MNRYGQSGSSSDILYCTLIAFSINYPVKALNEILDCTVEFLVRITGTPELSNIEAMLLMVLAKDPGSFLAYYLTIFFSSSLAAAFSFDIGSFMTSSHIK